MTTTVRTITFLVLVTSFFCHLGHAQTDMTSRIEFQQKKIKTIKRSNFNPWDEENQKPFDKPVLNDITEEHYDTLGNLVLMTAKMFDENMKDMLIFRSDFEYDERGNKIAEQLYRNLLPEKSRWEYTYNLEGKKLTETTFDLNDKPHQTKYYFYNKKGVLVKDSLTKRGEPLFVTTYTYKNKKLQKKTSEWKNKVYSKELIETTYSYNKKGLLKNKVGPLYEDYPFGIVKTIWYYYDNHNRLIKKKIDELIIEYHYDNLGMLIEECDYPELTVEKYSFNTPFCTRIEYEYY